ncbi:MAG TPA: PEP-CTERM sorting domain-containing protein [Phycisphaerae bacterium]|nr:PEP-CTERM sorting domain-containing protein [Phycisphaerae bacterium]HOI53934.1 PEP-CTERM sorting domain-containing protein [Phycisphaerae bacterium]
MTHGQRGYGSLVAVAVAVVWAATPALAATWSSSRDVSDAQVLNEGLTLGSTATVVSVTITETGQLDVNGTLRLGQYSTPLYLPPQVLVEGYLEANQLWFHGGTVAVAPGGSLSTSGTTIVGESNALHTGQLACLHIHNGSFSTNGGKIQFYSTGYSDKMLKVSGSGNTLSIGELALTNTTGTATLAFELDGNSDRGHITTLESIKVAWSVLTVDLGTLDGFSPTADQVFQLVTVTGAGNSLPSLANVTLAGWDSVLGNTDKLYNGSWQLRTSSDGKSLEAVAVPEPATMGLMGLGAAGLVMRRRRK